jgi:hypothetical protein
MALLQDETAVSALVAAEDDTTLRARAEELLGRGADVDGTTEEIA